MGSLEIVVGNFEKGAVTGIAGVVDPFGRIISVSDKWLTGAGYSSPRAPKTLHNAVYREVYEKPDEPVDFATGSVPRGVGNLVGGGLAAVGFYALYKTGGWIAAATIPAITGIYSGVQAVKKYIHDFIHGEKAEENIFEKGSFSDGFRFGWHAGTHFYMSALHDLEGNLTGRGLENSHVESSIKGSSTAARRNFSQMAGNVVGGFVGALASIASLGILPLYKSIRDTINTLDGKKAETYEPTMKIQHFEENGTRGTLTATV